MKILFLSGMYPPDTKGGGEISTHLIARGLVARGHDVTVIAEGEPSEETYQGVRVKRVPLGLTKKPLFERRASKRTAQALQNIVDDSGQYDVIHAHDFRSALALSETGWDNTVVTVRDYAQISGTTNFVLANGHQPTSYIQDSLFNQRIKEASWLRKPFRAWQYLFNTPYRTQAFRKIPSHIYISDAERDVVASKQELGGIRTTVVYNPVPEEYISTPVKPSTGFNLLYVGRLEDYKGGRLLLHAWFEIASEFPSATLTLVGEGAQADEYREMIEGSDFASRTKVKGKVAWENVINVYDSSDIFVAPHLWEEPFGRVVVEAMARGKVVVSSNRGGPGEFIVHGETGFLFDPERDGLVAALRDVLGMSIEKRQLVGETARRWVASNLSPERIAERYEQFYTKKSN